MEPEVRYLLVICTGALLAAGCGGAPTLTPNGLETRAHDGVALLDAADQYYKATTVEALRSAVEAARAAGADTALYHEIAADLARFEDRHGDRTRHLLAALLDPASDQALVHLHDLTALPWSLDERVRAEEVLRAVAGGHPDHAVRARAVDRLAGSLHIRGLDEEREEWISRTGYRVPLAIVGTWDNDQGKGFDTELPPEREMDLDARYRGRLIEIGWRPEPPSTARGHLDLDELLTPDGWSIAYAAASVKARNAGPYELRVSTSGPVKIWVNEVLVFEDRRVEGYLFDGFVLPVALRQGVNRILIKTAHQVGSWSLLVRLTEAGGVPPALDAFESAPIETEFADGARPGILVQTESLLAQRVAALPQGSARRAFLAARWAQMVGRRASAATQAEEYATQFPGSLRARYLLASALWNNQERGRTADMLAELVGEVGGTLILTRLQQARFWRQQKLGEKARATLIELLEAYPSRPSSYFMLAQAFEDEDWTEERCEVLAELNRRWSDWPKATLAWGACLEAQRFYPRAAALYRRLLTTLPNSYRALSRLHWQHQGNDELDVAEAYASRLTAAWPQTIDSWQKLAETRRRKGDRAGALAAIERARAIDPSSPRPFRFGARLSYQGGDRVEAIALWKAALARDPEDDKLVNRLAHLAPEARGPWAADVPSEADLIAAVATGATAKPGAGADINYLLDDEVTELQPDGSTAQVITLVARALSKAGRDSLTRLSIRPGGRSRILHAFATDPSGRRLEASSIRGREVRFRQLSVDSTVVLQYRLDSPPDGYLAGHMGRQWWFQQPRAHTMLSRWVVWMPAGTLLAEATRGAIERTEREVDQQVRVEWRATELAPVIREPAMPTLQEVAVNIVVSTVPGWEVFQKWEEALLRDVFRESPEVVALANALFEGAESVEEKLARIQGYLMTDIRYQQDYERHIAGVKPHAAPVVLARQYGDCKDKAVLFITLARLVGIDVHFALLRTRNAGPVHREVPMQQFNHAVVYVPAQPGLAEGQFFDPTVDALDVGVLRHDDQGTWSLVLDPVRKTHTWRFVPFQDPSLDLVEGHTSLRLRADGSASGTTEVTARGRFGETLRQAARNPEHLAQLLQRQVADTYAGGRLVSHELQQYVDVRRPAQMTLELEAPTVGRREGEDLRIKLPHSWSPSEGFKLASRRYPMLLGTPRTMRWDVDLGLPEGSRIKRLPGSGRVESQCISLERKVVSRPDRVSVRQTVQFRCERIAVADYATHRAQADEMVRLLDEELVVALGSADGSGRGE